MSSTAGPIIADLRSYDLIQRTLDQQSATYAYVDDFRYLAILCFLCTPVVFLVKKVRARKGAAARGTLDGTARYHRPDTKLDARPISSKKRSMHSRCLNIRHNVPLFPP